MAKNMVAVFLLVFIILSVRSLNLDKGCEVKSEWRLNYEWPNIRIGVWVPPEHNNEIITIETRFKDQTYPLIHDNIIIKKDELKFEQMRRGKDVSLLNSTSISINDGWLNLELEVSKYYTLKNLDSEVPLLLNASVNFIPDILTIKGSNVTCNCHSKMRVWKASSDPVVLPIDASDQHWLSLYSSSNFSPTITADLRPFSLGWDGQALSTIPSILKPLPAFQNHNISFSFKHEKGVIMGILKVGESPDKSEDASFAEVPKSLSVSGNEGDSFSVILYEDNPILSHEIEFQSTEIVTPSSFCVFEQTQEKSWHLWVIVALITLVSLLLMVIIFTMRKPLLNKLTNIGKNLSRQTNNASPHELEEGQGNNNNGSRLPTDIDTDPEKFPLNQSSSEVRECPTMP